MRRTFLKPITVCIEFSETDPFMRRIFRNRSIHMSNFLISINSYVEFSETDHTYVDFYDANPVEFF